MPQTTLDAALEAITIELNRALARAQACEESAAGIIDALTSLPDRGDARRSYGSTLAAALCWCLIPAEPAPEWARKLRRARAGGRYQALDLERSRGAASNARK